MKEKDIIQETKLTIKLSAVDVEVAIHEWLSIQTKRVLMVDKCYVLINMDKITDHLIGARVEIIKSK